MKKSLLFALVLAMTLLSACGPRGEGEQSSGPSVPTRPPAAGELSEEGSGSVSSSEPAPEVPAPDLEVLNQWRSDYRYDTQYLRQSLHQLAQSYDLTTYARWPGGRELAFLEDSPLLFSGPATGAGSVCAAVALDLRQPATVDQLLEAFGPSLTFRPDDPVAGPSWTVTDGSLTYRFRTDPADQTGHILLPEGLGGNLVLSVDELLPEAPSPDWISAPLDWVDLWEVQSEGPLAALLPYAQALGTSGAPEGAAEPADKEYLDLCYSGYGVKDPATGVQYISYEGGENTLWDGVVVPASLVFGDAPPQNADALMDAVSVPFRWSAYNMGGYWFYLDQYAVCLSSDIGGAVPGDGYFLIRLGDNAG